MANKKIFMSVTATAAIASAFMAADSAEASSYQVKPGDSLWKIAQQNQTSVSELKSINNLSGDIIFPNQIIQTTRQSSGDKVDKPQSNNNAGANTAGKATTYTVKSGDTLSKIAFEHKISLNELMTLNNLETTLIFPGNVFVVSKNGGSAGGGNSGANSNGAPGQSAGSGSAANAGGSSNNQTATSVYVVKSGDTLSGIGSRHGVSVANLKRWNNLSSDLIFIGQKLSINGSSAVKPGNNGSNNSEKPTANVSYNVDKLIQTAKSVIGVPYVWGGQTTSGFDCSGFIHYAYNNAGRSGGRLSTDGYYTRSYAVNTPQVGDLVFFEGTYRAGISHMGIYLGNNEFIHAGSSTGVTISSLNDPYWKKHFEGFKRFY